MNWAGTMGLGTLALAAGLGLALPHAHAANIITFGDNANACGGAVMCSTNGTTGYLTNGSGQAFDLTTINNWFQIDTTGVNELAAQSMAEPNGGAGAFLVRNNTGSTVTTFSLTISDSFCPGPPRSPFVAAIQGRCATSFKRTRVVALPAAPPKR
jgi:hypothetical protein